MLVSHGFELAEYKTEAVLVSSRCRIACERVQAKYPGVMLDHRLTFKKHLNYVGEGERESCYYVNWHDVKYWRA